LLPAPVWDILFPDGNYPFFCSQKKKQENQTISSLFFVSFGEKETVSSLQMETDTRPKTLPYPPLRSVPRLHRSLGQKLSSPT